MHFCEWFSGPGYVPDTTSVLWTQSVPSPMQMLKMHGIIRTRNSSKLFVQGGRCCVLKLRFSHKIRMGGGKQRLHYPGDATGRLGAMPRIPVWSHGVIECNCVSVFPMVNSVSSPLPAMLRGMCWTIPAAHVQTETCPYEGLQKERAVLFYLGKTSAEYAPLLLKFVSF